MDMAFAEHMAERPSQVRWNIKFKRKAREVAETCPQVEAQLWHRLGRHHAKIPKRSAEPASVRADEPASLEESIAAPATQRLQNPFIKKYTLNRIRVPIIT